MEYIIKCNKIDVFRCIFLIYCLDVFKHLGSDILEFLVVLPLLIEYLYIIFCHHRRHDIDSVVYVVASLDSELCGCKFLKWQIYATVFPIFQVHKSTHLFLR